MLKCQLDHAPYLPKMLPVASISTAEKVQVFTVVHRPHTICFAHSSLTLSLTTLLVAHNIHTTLAFLLFCEIEIILLW